MMTFDEWFSSKNFWAIESMREDAKPEYYCRSAWFEQQKEIDRLKKGIQEALSQRTNLYGMKKEDAVWSRERRISTILKEILEASNES